MATHSETMTIGEAALTGSFDGEDQLAHLNNCTSVLYSSTICSCGLDAAWTNIVMQAADLVTTYSAGATPDMIHLDGSENDIVQTG